jgi:DNA-binding NarL/FixJ family response regulator
MSARKITLLLADDHVLFCESLRTVLATEAHDIDVIGIARDGKEVLALVEERHPDVVLMDVRMPGMDGVQATRLIHERFPGTRVMMLTTFDDDEYVREAMKYGAEGYLLKDTPLPNLIIAIRALQEGVVQVSPAVVMKLAGGAPAHTGAGQQAEPDGGAPAWVRSLSPREKEIARLVAQGLDNPEIARALFIAEQTVKNHMSDIYFKLGVHDRGKVAVLVRDLPRDIRAY